MENLFAAWREFLRGKRQRPDVQEFSRNVEDRLFALHETLRDGIWRHGGYRAFQVWDPKPRLIHKASVADRVIHHAVARVLTPLFDRSFIFDSWSCRLGKGTHAAVSRCHKELECQSHNCTSPVWVLQGDIKRYFASIDHYILLQALEKRIQDANTIGLLHEIVGSFSPGIPLGNLTSQLFANVYLDDFDHCVKEVLRAPLYLRYSDDFLLAHQSRGWLLKQASLLERYLRLRLRLELHPRKLTVRPFHHGIDWLGYVLYPRYRIIRPRTRQRMWRRVGLSTDEYLSGKRSLNSLTFTFSSYYGILKYGWNRDDAKRLFALEQCL